MGPCLIEGCNNEVSKVIRNRSSAVSFVASELPQILDRASRYFAQTCSSLEDSKRQWMKSAREFAVHVPPGVKIVLPMDPIPALTKMPIISGAIEESRFVAFRS